jgi:hypothetical protein
VAIVGTAIVMAASHAVRRVVCFMVCPRDELLLLCTEPPEL